jgi:uncharacterized membrane protein
MHVHIRGTLKFYVYLDVLGVMVMEFEMFPLQILGIMLMVLGALLFVAPLVLERMPSLESVPWILLYVFRRDGFVFVTSPILIIVSILSLLWWILTRSGSP